MTSHQLNNEQASLFPSTDDLILNALTSNMESSMRIENRPPNSLICPICHHLMMNASFVRCCGSTFCEKCISSIKEGRNCDDTIICPGEGCGQKLFYDYDSNLHISKLARQWLDRSGLDEYKPTTKKSISIKPTPIKNRPPPSICCALCTNLLTETAMMYCCGTTFCRRCIENISHSVAPECPGPGCLNTYIDRGWYNPNFNIQHIAKEWLEKFELSKKKQEAKMVEQQQVHASTISAESGCSSNVPHLSLDSPEVVNVLGTSQNHGCSSSIDLTALVSMPFVSNRMDNSNVDVQHDAVTALPFQTASYPMSDIFASTLPEFKQKTSILPIETNIYLSRRSAPTTSQTQPRSSFIRGASSYSPYDRCISNKRQNERGRDTRRQRSGREKDIENTSGANEEFKNSRMKSAYNSKPETSIKDEKFIDSSALAKLNVKGSNEMFME